MGGIGHRQYAFGQRLWEAILWIGTNQEHGPTPQASYRLEALLIEGPCGIDHGAAQREHQWSWPGIKESGQLRRQAIGFITEDKPRDLGVGRPIRLWCGQHPGKQGEREPGRELSFVQGVAPRWQLDLRP